MPRSVFLLAIFVGLCGPGATAQPIGPGDTKPIGLGDDQAVTNGGKALETTYHYPWYDSATDSLTPIQVPSTRRWSWNLPMLDMLFDEPLKVLFWTLVTVLVAALFYVLVRAALRWKAPPPRVDESPEPTITPTRVESLSFMKERSKVDLLGAARAHYQAGNYSEAIVYLFSYELIQLDKSAIVHLALGKTNRQYVREAGRVRPLARLLEATMVRFEEVFFGGRTLDREGFEACWTQLPEFEALIAQAT